MAFNLYTKQNKCYEQLFRKINQFRRRTASSEFKGFQVVTITGPGMITCKTDGSGWSTGPRQIRCIAHSCTTFPCDIDEWCDMYPNQELKINVPTCFKSELLVITCYLLLLSDLLLSY